MKILVADKISQAGLDKLRGLGCDVFCAPDLAGEALVRALAESDCRVLMVRGTKVTGEAIRANRYLSLIVRVGAGYNSIDVQAASAASVMVANCPGRNATAVAELAFGLILALDRRIPDNVADLRAGKWAKKEYSKAPGLKGRTLGVVGVGRIGERVVLRALAFEMNVVGWSRSLTPKAASELGMVRVETPEELAARSDIVSVHLAANADTNKLIGEEFFDAMKPGAYFVNTARAEVVDHVALAQAVREKGLRVALDVFPDEPDAHDTVFQDSIIHLKGVVYGTHHIGASTDQAQDAVADEAFEVMREYISTGSVRNCVNLSVGKSPKGVLVVRHRNRPGVLANILAELSRAGINVREMENVICEGEEGACAQIRLDSEPSSDVLARIEKSDENILGITLMAAK